MRAMSPRLPGNAELRIPAILLSCLLFVCGYAGKGVGEVLSATGKGDTLEAETSRTEANEPEELWPVTPIRTSWDDLLEGIESPEAWAEKRKVIKRQFHDLILNDAAPEPPADLDVKVEKEIDGDGFRILYISYQVESDERAHAYLGIPDAPPPEGGFPGVVCLHGTTDWGARRTLGLRPNPGDPRAAKPSRTRGKDYARYLVRNGYVTISPEHFCCATRTPPEGSFDRRRSTANIRSGRQWASTFTTARLPALSWPRGRR